MKDIKREIEYVTHDRAQFYFDNRAELNRPLARKFVEVLVRDMQQGRWYYNGEPLRFNTDGRLFDGQHRLRAFLDSGLDELPFAIEKGLDTNAASVTDTGRKRSTSHFFHMEGRPYAIQLAVATRHIHNYIEFGTFAHQFAVSVNEQRSIIVNFPEIEKYVKAYSYEKLPIQIPSASLAALHTLFRATGPKAKADEFMEKLVSGEDLTKDDQRLTARNYITRRSWGSHGISKQWLSDKFTIRAMAVIVNAWNKWRAGEQYAAVKPIRICPVISK